MIYSGLILIMLPLVTACTTSGDTLELKPYNYSIAAYPHTRPEGQEKSPLCLSQKRIQLCKDKLTNNDSNIIIEDKL